MTDLDKRFSMLSKLWLFHLDASNQITLYILSSLCINFFLSDRGRVGPSTESKVLSCIHFNFICICKRVFIVSFRPVSKEEYFCVHHFWTENLGECTCFICKDLGHFWLGYIRCWDTFHWVLTDQILKGSKIAFKVRFWAYPWHDRNVIWI